MLRDAPAHTSWPRRAWPFRVHRRNLSMNHVNVRLGALAALSAMLLGCASAPPLSDDAGIFSDTRPKGKDDATVTSRPVGAPTNIDGAVRQAQAQRRSG